MIFLFIKSENNFCTNLPFPQVITLLLENYEFVTVHVNFQYSKNTNMSSFHCRCMIKLICVDVNKFHENGALNIYFVKEVPRGCIKRIILF